ncbi:MAG: efflux RND transporter periplasmic adaptor subunit [Anaerolineae bacterium]|nr:efflux RND transporter periplasmic adaptor subunit [Anaerolineae bacterium]
MKKRIVPLVIVAVVIVALAVTGIYLAANNAAWQQLRREIGLAEPEQAGITASGFIEAEEVSIAPEIGGRIAAVLVAEGDQVESGQVLARLDDTLLQAQVDLAQAGLEVAQATLDQVQAGARPEAIRQAEATLAQAEAGRDGAYQAWQDMLALLENPQELDAQIALASAQLEQAEAELRQANALRDAAQIAQDNFSDTIAQYPPGETRKILVASGALEDILEGLPPELIEFLVGLGDGSYTYEDWEITIEDGYVTIYRWVTFGYPLEFHLIPTNYWRSWVGVNAAQAAYDAARQTLALLYDVRDNPQQLQAQVDAAESQYRAAEALVEIAQAQLDGLQAGATDEEIAAVEAQVQQAQAQLESARVLLEKQTLTAPASGWVLQVIGHEGELAVPGAVLVTLADLDQVRLTIYVPENRLGQIFVGQRVEVSVDSFPDRVFVGWITAISSEAEFTPRNVQTQAERVNMVFAVQVVIPNPNHDLKPGMPADAVILAAGE